MDFTENTLSLVLFQAGFDVTGDIYIVAEDNAGHVTKQKLKLQPGDLFDGVEFSLGDKIQLTLPSDIPLIGGSKLGLDLEDGVLPVSVAVNKRKVKAAIGFDVAKASESTTEDKVTGEIEEEKEITNFVKEIKNIKKLKESGKESIDKLKDRVKNVRNNWGKALTQKKGTFGVNADFTITGYMEAYIDKDGEMQITESGIVMLVSAGADWGGNFPLHVVVVTVPVYWEASISGEIEAAFDMYYSGKDQKYTPGGSLSAKLEGSVGGGLGHSSIATIGGGGKMALSPKAQFYSDRKSYFSMTTSVNFYFKVTAFKIYEKVWEPDWAKAEWTTDNGQASDQAGSTKEGLTGAGLPEDFYDPSAYTQSNLDYILEPADSPQAGAGPQQNTSGNYAHTVLNFKENAFTQTSPKMVEFEDGTRLALWLDASTNDLNSVKVNYSYYNGAQWTPASVVDPGTTADLSFDVYASGRTACVVWQNASNKINAGDTMAQLKDVKIKAAVFDSTGVFQDAAVLNTNADVLTALPVVFGNGDNVTAAWVENTGTDWFLTEGTNAIYTSRLLEGNVWSQPFEFAGGLKAVTSLDGDVDDQGQTYLAYSMDQDNNLETAGDQEVYVSSGQTAAISNNLNYENAAVSGDDTENGEAVVSTPDEELAVISSDTEGVNQQAAADSTSINTVQVTSNDVCDTFVQFADHTLYWVRGGNVFYSSPVNISEQPVLAQGQELLFQTYSVAGQGDNKVVLFSAKDGLKSSIKGAFYQSTENAWGAPAVLTDPEDNVDIPAFSAIRTNKNTLEMLCNRTKVTGELKEGNQSSYNDMYGQTDLALMQYDGSCEISVQDNCYQKNEIMPDGALPVTLSVTNNHIEPISGVAVKVMDGADVVQEVDVSAPILSGCTEDIKFTCEIKEEYIGRPLYLKCAPLENRDYTVPASETSISLEYENMGLENLKWSYISDDTISITGDVKNLGFTKAEQVSASLHKGTPDSEVLETVSMGQVESLDTAEVSFEVPYEDDALYYVTLSVPESDQDPADDTDYVVLKAQEDNTGRSLKALSASLKKKSYTVGEKLDLSGLLVEAEYTDGTKNNVKEESVIDISKVNMKKAGTYTITIKYGGKTKTVQIKVADNKVKKGSKVTVNQLNYKVTAVSGKNRTVAFTGCKDKKTRKKLVIPETIKISKVTYKVTAVQSKACSGCSKLTNVTVGANVTVIGDQAFANCKALKSITCKKGLKQIKPKAFSGCRKLQKITLKSKKLTKIGKNAWKGISAKAEIRVPASKLKTYQKLLSKKSTGYQKGWKIKK